MHLNLNMRFYPKNQLQLFSMTEHEGLKMTTLIIINIILRSLLSLQNYTALTGIIWGTDGVYLSSTLFLSSWKTKWGQSPSPISAFSTNRRGFAMLCSVIEHDEKWRKHERSDGRSMNWKWVLLLTSQVLSNFSECSITKRSMAKSLLFVLLYTSRSIYREIANIF